MLSLPLAIATPPNLYRTSEATYPPNVDVPPRFKPVPVEVPPRPPNPEMEKKHQHYKSSTSSHIIQYNFVTRMQSEQNLEKAFIGILNSLIHLFSQ